ncbi:MFS transporter [Sphaerisporangium sp. NPDC004334]
MLQSPVSPVLPTIQHDLRTTQSTVTWGLIAWLLSASIATPLLGRIGDMIGKERTLLVALGAIAAGDAVAALAPNIAVLIAGYLSGPIAPFLGVKAQLVWGSVFCLVASAALAAFHDRPWQIAVALIVPSARRLVTAHGPERREALSEASAR